MPKMGKKVYINGRYVAAEKAVVSVFDRGLNYGDGLFETIPAYGGEPFLYEEHTRRLRAGMRALKIPLKGIERIGENARVAKKLLMVNGLTDRARIKIIVTRGVGGSGHLPAPAKEQKPTLIMTAEVVDEEAITRLQRRGVRSIIVEGLNPLNSMVGGVKSLSFLPSVLAKGEAVRARAYEAIFVDSRGFVTEGSSTNIFALRRGIVITPPLSSGLLPGITRETVIRLARKAGFKVKEGRIRATELASLDEAFLTNSIIEIVPLVRCGADPVGLSSGPGAVTKTLQAAYKGLIRPE